MIRTLIIDDEENIRLRLKDMILENFPQITVVGEAEGVETGVKAIENLKPVSVDDLRIAFIKAEEQIITDLKLQLATLQNNLQSPKNKTIALRTSEKIYLLDVNNIVRCEADRSYTYFFVNEQKKHIVSQPMKEFEDMLKEHGFVRIHKSHLINMSYIDSFDKADGGYIILKDKTEIPVSRRKKSELLERFSKL
jgi:two-component system LytT family response regulator